MPSSYRYILFPILMLSTIFLIFTDGFPAYADDVAIIIPRHAKRFNFNFLRTWQPLSKAEPITGAAVEASVDAYPNQSLESSIDEFPNTSKHRIRQKLMCIAALQSTKACQDL